MRIILYTGKGGVGKTTTAAATALRAARRGLRTIVLSTDAAHSLGDSFDVTLGAEPTPIATDLWGQEIDVLVEMERHWGTIHGWLMALLHSQGSSDLVASEVAILPGMDELAGLLNIIHHAESSNYDLCVVDCAPTADTLKLLSFPEMARWYMQRVFPIERRAMSIVRPVLRPFVDIPLPTDQVFDAVQKLFEQLRQMREILVDPERSSVRLVVNPEKMVVKEALRTYTYLNLYGYFTDLVICNRVLPKEATTGYFVTWKEVQERNLELIRGSFAPLPIYNVPLMEQDVVGLEMLERVGEALFDDKDPAAFQFRGVHQAVTEESDGTYLLTLPLPFIHKEEVNLIRAGDELVVQAGHFRRNMFLPRLLAAREVTEAKMEEDRLVLRFPPPEPARVSAPSSRKDRRRPEGKG
ncbi:MAG: ArsA family ATPase [Chloroflexi bacterium]|nr:ArsA family ATPase [Chloroflexota bacterium]